MREPFIPDLSEYPKVFDRTKIPVHPGLHDLYHNKNKTMITKKLFFEESLDDQSYAIFTLRSENDIIVDHFMYRDGKSPMMRVDAPKKLYSIRKLYLESRDPTEYTFAKRCFPSWAHWQAVQNLKVLQPYIQSWRDEMEVFMMSEGVRQVADLATQANYNAAKFLVEKGWLPKRGRPTKAEIERERKKVAMVQEELEDDLSRVASLLPEGLSKSIN
jgi:hypothetical protein